MSGSFDYDSDTDALSPIDVITTADTEFGGDTYSSGDVSGLQFALTAAGSDLYLFFSDPLTDAGGTINASALEIFLDNGVNIARAANNSGSVSATSTPEPSTSLLFLAGLGMVVSACRKARQRTASEF